MLSSALSPNRIIGTAWTGSNDGESSGLDAGTLDGKHATDFGNPTGFDDPSGSITLGMPGDTRLRAAGYQLLGPSNLTINRNAGFWLAMKESANGLPGREFHTAVWTGQDCWRLSIVPLESLLQSLFT